MDRPSFQFYPKDWHGNSNLRRCGFSLRGIWIDVMCLMHDQAEYGVIRWPLHEIANTVGCKVKDLQELYAKRVIKGVDEDGEFDGFMFIPTHAGKKGSPVTIIAPTKGPLWFSSRMVTDEYKRQLRAANGAPPKGGIGVAFGSTNGIGIGAAPSHAHASRAGLSSSSSSSLNTTTRPNSASPNGDAPDPIFGDGFKFLTGKGVEERRARAFLALQRKQYDDPVVSKALADAKRLDVSEPLSWLTAALKATAKPAPGNLDGINYRQGVNEDGTVAS